MRQIPGLPQHYLADEEGRIWSFLSGKAHEMVGWTDCDGYRNVSLRLPGRRTPKRFRAARLVALTFIGPAPAGSQLRHLDGNNRNDAPGNLAWGTAKENAADKARHGTILRGPENPRTKLTQEIANTVARMRREGLSQQRIADTLGMAQSQVSRILHGETWVTPTDAESIPSPQRLRAEQILKAREAIVRLVAMRGAMTARDIRHDLAARYDRRTLVSALDCFSRRQDVRLELVQEPGKRPYYRVQTQRQCGT